MHAAKPSGQLLRLKLILKHGCDAGAGKVQPQCKRTLINGIAAVPQVSNVKKGQTYIQQSCGIARALRPLVDTASFIIWMYGYGHTLSI